MTPSMSSSLNDAAPPGDACPTQDAWATTWYLAYSKPRLEHQAAEQLENQGYVTYLPVCSPGRRSRSAQGAAPALEPMFPRYVFFRRGHPQQALGPARSTRGVSTLVSFGTGPAVMSDCLINGVREVERLRRLDDASPASGLKVGDRVRMSRERLQCLEGMVTAVAGERVTLLLQILGRETALRVHCSEVETL